MSINDSVTSRGHDNSNNTDNSSKKYVFKREQKTGSDGADVMVHGAATRDIGTLSVCHTSLYYRSYVVVVVPDRYNCGLVNNFMV